MKSSQLPSQITRTRRFTAGIPGQFTIAAGGATVLFLRSRAGDDPANCLWLLNLETGSEQLLADPAELLGKAGPSISSYATDSRAALVAFALSGGLWVVDAATSEVRQLPAASPAADPRPDPAGQRIAYVCAGALRMIEADGAADRVIVAPDGPDVQFGVAEQAAVISLQGSQGFWWAPDGGRLLVARIDFAGVELWQVANPAEPGRQPRAVRYPPAGSANAEVSLWIVRLDGGQTEVRWDRTAFEYVPRVGWDSHGPYAAVQSRDQGTLSLLAIDPADGSTTVLSEQRDQRWVQLVPGLPARTASGSLIAHADLTDTRHLTVNGVAVTPPGLQLREVLSVDGEQILFAASEEPRHTQLFSYRPRVGVQRESSESGVYGGIRRDGTLVHTAVCADRPGGRTVVTRDGRPPVAVECLAEQPSLEMRATQLVLGPRNLRAALYFPSWHCPGSGPLPVLANPYGGSASQRVTTGLDWQSVLSQWFAEQGFAVLVADGRGTPGRGPDWEKAVHGDLFGPVLEDQVAALHEAARLYPDLDLGRVGIRGWSFGGSLAAVAVLRRPDVFHAAVAGAGVTDQRLYNTHWRERVLGHPDEFPERYDAASLVLAAPQLTRPLMLVHGLADENVFPVHTFRLSSALLAAGRPHEVWLVPGAGHPDLGPDMPENLLWQQVRFLQRHLDASPASG